jgi:DNA polymerase
MSGSDLSFDGSFADWKRAARAALAAGVAPEHVRWIDRSATQTEFSLDLAPPPEPATDGLAPARPAPDAEIRVPRAFLDLAADVACHRDPARWALLYRALWRLTHGEPRLLESPLDPDTHALQGLAKAVHREVHKMRAFVRFREVATEAGPWFVAWFEPEHAVVELNAAFFRDRFAKLRWSILTPGRSMHWDPVTRRLDLAPGARREDAPAADAAEDLWRTYYASIFNPARVKVGAMLAEMPRRYWQNLPEAALIPRLLSEAGPRVEAMVEKSAARSAPHATGQDRAPVPATADLAELARAAAGCRACPLWRDATCTVFGEGPREARVVLVGEQPGDQEDLAGKPFVGPAGKLLDRALAAAGVDRGACYVTNAVKHFKWTPRGKRRLHAKPGARELAACRPWLEAELAAIRPALIVCLGATAAQAVLGEPVRVTEERGRRLATRHGAPALITVHPSSLLRLPPGLDPDAEFERFVADLREIQRPP